MVFAAAAMVSISLVPTVIFLGLVICARATAFAVLCHAATAVTARRSPHQKLGGSS